jgi:CheY-like chemotaxis protein/GAF domain-containing protein
MDQPAPSNDANRDGGDKPAAGGSSGQAASPGGHRYELRGPLPLTPEQRATLAGFTIADRAVSPTVSAHDADRAARALELLGQGVGIVDSQGEIVWMSQGLARQAPETLRRFADCCVEAIASWRRSRQAAASQRANFRSGTTWYETVMTPFRRGSEDPVDGAVALLIDATASRRLQDRLDAIDQAGAELLQFDAEGVRAMNAPERLRALENKVVAATRSVLGFDHFEYRLTDRRTAQLELVFCSGLVPLGIGERIFARGDGNGISGVVATTGESVICPETEADPRYIKGLPGAHSSVTVPLRLHGRVVGVLNAESIEPGFFDDEDRICAELLGRYVALSLNVLDMLVVERCETNRTVVEHLASEASGALAEIAADARTLLGRADNDEERDSANRVLEDVSKIDDLLRNASSGPKGVLGAADFLREGMRDPAFAGRNVLVADDDVSIRGTVRAVLEQQGCTVHECSEGTTAIRLIRERAAAGRPFDLVISDVRMPDANGYEVFRATKDASASTPMMLMTAFGYDPHHSIVRSSQEGLHCFLFKPFQVSQLLDEARKALTEGSSRPS